MRAARSLVVLDAALAHVLFGLVADHHVARDLALGASTVYVARILRGDLVAGLVLVVFELALAFFGNACRCWEGDRHRGRSERNDRRGFGGWSRRSFARHALLAFNRLERRWRRARSSRHLRPHGRGKVGWAFVAHGAAVSRFGRHGRASVRGSLAVLHGADDFVSHAVAVFAGLARWHLCTVLVVFALVHAANLGSFSRHEAWWHGRCSFSTAVVSRRAAAGPGEDGRAAVHVQLAVL